MSHDGIVFTKASLLNLACVLEGMDIGLFDPLRLRTVPESGRPFLEIGPANEYGSTPKLILDDSHAWELDFASRSWGAA